jgi:tRNA U38,U39,U40 pseudouridine synthase TruA
MNLILANMTLANIILSDGRSFYRMGGFGRFWAVGGFGRSFSCLPDFSAFRAAGCRANTPNRNITNISVERDGDWITLNVSANAFLQHMVRNITGTLASVGEGEHASDWIAEVLASRDRKKGGIAAPPHGLTLISVDYPDAAGIPAPRTGCP